jgi:hypothetical protein
MKYFNQILICCPAIFRQMHVLNILATEQNNSTFFSICICAVAKMDITENSFLTDVIFWRSFSFMLSACVRPIGSPLFPRGRSN